MTLVADADCKVPPQGAVMPEHRALRALAARSDRRGLMQLALHMGALLASGLLVAQAWGSLWLALAMPLHGILLTFLFAPLHETIHRTAFRRRWLNDATAWLCGLALALPPEYFRAFHFAHHRHTQDPARDPELAEPKPESIWAYVRHVSGLPYWYSRLTTLARHARGRVEEPFITERLRPRIVREARLYLAVYALVLMVSIATGSLAALIFWLIPALLGQPFLRCYLLAEHTAVRWSPTCCGIRGPRAASPRCAASPGTCPITPSITPDSIVVPRWLYLRVRLQREERPVRQRPRS